MNHPTFLLSTESPFLDEGELLEPEAPQVARKPLDDLLSETPFLSLEIDRFEADEEFLQMESQETRYDGDPPKKELPTEMHEPETSPEEYNGRSKASITGDFSLRGLADGTLGNIPDAIRRDLLSGRNRELWDLTNRVFWDKYPGLTNTALNPKDPKQKTLVAEYGRMTRDVKALLWLTRIVELIDKHRGDLPRDFLLGWMAKESDGRVGVTTSLGERGYFQIHPAEFREILKLRDTDFQRVSTDREFSIRQGIALVQAHRSNITANYSVSDPSELLCKLTKARHGLPGLLKATLDGMKKSGTAIEWDAVAAKMRNAGDRGVSSNVEKTMEYASNLKTLADQISEPLATMPELHDEQELLDEETGVIDGDNRKQIKNTFQQPYQWICRIALRKNGKEVDLGSGFLISDRHVLTAAHVVEKAFKEPATYDIGVKIAMNWDTDLGEYFPGKPRLSARYKAKVTPSTLDYALLTISDSPGAKKLSKLKGKTLGHFARANVAATDVQGTTGHTAGYPTEKDRVARKMFAASGRLTFPGDRALEAAPFLQYSGDTTKGQSGSPVWLNGEDGIQLVGIAIVAGQTSNTVLRLNAAVWTQLDEWMGEQESESERDDEGLSNHDVGDVNDRDFEASGPELELDAGTLTPDTIEEEEPRK